MSFIGIRLINSMNGRILFYCERNELLICKVNNLGSGVSKTVHVDQSQHYFGTSLIHFEVVIFGTSLILYSVIL